MTAANPGVLARDQSGVTLVQLSPVPAVALGGPLTAPFPAPSLVVHAVTATFGASGWTLSFGRPDQQIVVRRLAGADAAARRLVATCLGGSPADVRVRIVPDAETLTRLRRRTPWWRTRSDEV